MAPGIRAIEIKSSGKTLKVQALGQTPRGRRVLGRSVTIKAKNPADPHFKEEMAAAVDELLNPPPITV